MLTDSILGICTALGGEDNVNTSYCFNKLAVIAIFVLNRFAPGTEQEIQTPKELLVIYSSNL